MKRIALVCLALLGGLLSPHAASAGGWWANIDVDRRNVVPGQHLTIDSEHLFPGDEVSGVVSNRTAYHAYLLEGFDRARLDEAMTVADPGPWLRVTGPVHLLGTLSVTDHDSNLVMMYGRFMVPELPPGRYDLMLCDEDCDSAMADAIPMTIWVTNDPVAARAANRSERSAFRIEMAEQRLRHRLKGLRQEIRELAARVEELESSSDDGKEDPSRPASAIGSVTTSDDIAAGSIAVAAIVSLAALASWFRSRRPSHGRP